MVYAIIRSYVGSIGRTMIDFYLANSFVINGIILLYALLVFISQRNYYFALEKLYLNIGLVKEGENGILVRKAVESDFKNLSWNRVRKEIWFPLISAPGKWTFRFCTADYLESEFTREKINLFIKNINVKENKDVSNS